jgi:hypothetical protein
MDSFNLKGSIFYARYSSQAIDGDEGPAIPKGIVQIQGQIQSLDSGSDSDSQLVVASRELQTRTVTRTRLKSERGI